MKVIEDILEVKHTKKINTTMYEVNDSNRAGEYGRHSGDKYVKSFIEFIESLGYEPKREYDFSSTILIDGFSFHINTDNASYMSKGGWTRRVDIRKPENRFITLTSGGYNSGNIIKVHFNKELDADKLRAKINKHIEEQKAIIQRNKDIAANNETSTIEIATHYLNNEIIKKAVKYICIEKSLIIFYLNDTAQVCVNSDNTLKDASFYEQDIKTPEALTNFTNTIADRSKAFEAVILEILAMPKISERLAEWSKEAYHRRFYTKTMSTEYD